MGDSDRAIDAAERALSLVTTSGESSLAYAVALNNVGVALHHKGAIEKALRAYEKSLETFQEIIGLKEAPDDVAMAEFHMARIHSNLGLAYWGRGDPAQAYRHFRFAQEQMADEERVARTERGALAEMAELSVELDVFLTLERAMPALPGERIALQMLLERKGAVLEEQTRTMGGFRTAAEQSAPRSQSPRKSLADFFGFGTQERIVQQAEQLRQALRGDSPSEDREVMQEYETVLAQRSALEHLKTASPEEEAAKQRAATDLDTRIQAIQQHIQTRVESRELIQRRKAVGAPDPKALAEAMGNARTDAELDEIEKRHMAQLRSQAGVEQQRKRSERLALLQRIQSRIPDNSALLEMVQYRPFDPRADLPENRWGAARYGVYLIRRTGAPIYIDYGEAEPIDKLITEFRRSLVQPPWTLARDLGRRLDARLMQPVREHLDAMTQLLLAPEGLLNLIPFGALVDERDRYLIETFSFNYLASGRDLLRPEKHDKPRSPALIVADPNFDVEGPAIASAQPGPASTQAARSRNFSGIRFDSLPGTAAEARALKHILPDAVTLTGLQATETALKQIKGPRILHVATHGFFLEDQGTNPSEASRRRGNTGHTAENPMLRSGLAFTGANLFRSGNDDGILTALEAAGLDLVGTRLVVLSACDTGAGDVKNGEGVFGLRRAFVVAGAETILMSLFQVEDEATKSLMVDYYRRLAQGEGRTEALRQAQLAFLQDPAHRHPLFWASFISSGESGRM
jgi:CHAT domain-containing protein